MTLALVLTSAAQGADRAFSVRFTANDTGNIAFAANTLMTCPATASNCAAAQGGAADDNNDFAMRYVDVDTDPATFDSSSADLGLPAGATVLFAGLYWGADTSAGTGGKAAPSAAANGSVLLASPGGAYQAVSASTLDTSSSQPTRYQGFADVTAQVRSGGAGTYTLANVQAGTGADRYAGWTLVVAYHDSTQPPRNLTVFDGLGTVNSGSPSLNIPVSGFVTPTSGPVRTTLGFVAWEGDRGLTGDSATLNSTTLADAANPANNFFNSSIADDGVNVTGRNPDYVNQLGFDADLFDADGILPNGATSATIHLTTGGETYFPAVVTFATELFAPRLVPDKTASATAVTAGGTIIYTISATNTGQDTATGVTITDPVPAGTTVVPGSLQVVSSPGGIAGSKTDASGDDQAEVTGSNVVFRVGSGASATAGGTLAPGQGYTVSFAVRVDSPARNGTVIQNTATNSYAAQSNPSFGLSDTSSPPTQVTVHAPDLELSKTDSGGFVRGGSGSFDLTARNTGDAPTTGTVTVTDDVPADLPVTSAAGSGWTCTVTGQTVTCTRADALAAGQSFPAIAVAVGVSATAPATVTNTAEVAGGGDGDVSNNSASDTVTVTSDADLGIVKSVSPAIPVAGAPATFHLLVSNAGPSDAAGVVVSDSVPAALDGATAATTAGSCAISTGTLTCSVAALAAGASFEVDLTGTVDPGAATGTLDDTATVTAAGNDPDPSNNSSTLTPRVTAEADMGITKTLAPMHPLVGAEVTYTITATNRGPSNAHDVQVNDPLPAQLEGAAARTSQGSCSISATDRVSCDMGTFAPGASATVTVIATVRPGTAGDTLSNTATVSATEPDPNLTDNAANVTAAVEGATLTAHKTALRRVARAGSDVGYRIVIRVGGGTATGVTACDVAPAHTSYVSIDGATLRRGQACWTFASLPAGARVVRHVVLHIDADASAGPIRNLLVVSAADASTVRREAPVRVTVPQPGHPHGRIPIVTG